MPVHRFMLRECFFTNKNFPQKHLSNHSGVNNTTRTQAAPPYISSSRRAVPPHQEEKQKSILPGWPADSAGKLNSNNMLKAAIRPREPIGSPPSQTLPGDRRLPDPTPPLPPAPPDAAHAASSLTAAASVCLQPLSACSLCLPLASVCLQPLSASSVCLPAASVCL